MMNFVRRWFAKKEDATPVRDVAALAAPLAAPAVHIVKTDAPSRSHFGGAPNLPAGAAWPVRNGTRLAFLAKATKWSSSVSWSAMACIVVTARHMSIAVLTRSGRVRQTGDAMDVLWGDAGVVYYWVEERQARAGRFENAWLILQCH